MKFSVTDVFGNTVVGSFSAWDHITKRHPEMAGRETEVKAAIERPISVHEGNIPADSLFYGDVISTGFWKGSSPVVAVHYGGNKTGFLKTAYLVNRAPRGVIKWQKS